jgi:hypothetical protein
MCYRDRLFTFRHPDQAFATVALGRLPRFVIFRPKGTELAGEIPRSYFDPVLFNGVAIRG